MRRILLVSALLAAGCGRGLDGTCEETLTCPGVDGGADVIADVSVDAPPGCDLTKDPKDSLACVADSVGMFVDATNGDDAAGDGSKAKPVKTIGKALEKVGSKPRIYVCDGTYAEDVVLDASHDGVSLYGGWKCADWSYTGVRPVVGKTAEAMRIDSLTKPVVVADLDAKAADGAGPGASSVAMRIVQSANISLVRVKLEAGIGQAGANGTQPAQASKAADGASSTSSTGGAQCKNTCSDGDSIGGKGGDVGNNNSENGAPALGGGLAGLGNTSCGSGGSGANGNPGGGGNNGSGAATLGSIASGKWAPLPGDNGGAGTRGQGGGGGGARAGGGGGGGCGGCGGAGGPGGGGGGASVALVVVTSTVTLEASELAAAGAGSGGAGASGALGQPLGTGGNGFTASPSGCPGGDGATGGSGGPGGGGAGGISVGVLWKGTAAPTIDASTTSKITVAAKGGNKGLGGATPSNDGIDGVAQAVLEVK